MPSRSPARKIRSEAGVTEDLETRMMSSFSALELDVPIIKEILLKIGRESSEDQHQKVRQVREGDVDCIAFGIFADWDYNNGIFPVWNPTTRHHKAKEAHTRESNMKVNMDANMKTKDGENSKKDLAIPRPESRRRKKDNKNPEGAHVVVMRTTGEEETFCTARLKININDPEDADVFNPRAGHLTTVNKALITPHPSISPA
ncbi:hypothetical protein NC652_040586 [Populus alba x Populus x berolinensis]|nr:hypothetical protein NC652_040586 [Populus alba x Populus x berolinensis]